MAGRPLSDAGLIILDLDGPLLETKWRQHACYAEFLTAHGRLALDVEDFWRRKRGGASTRMVLEDTGHADLAPAAARHWSANIERADLMRLDAVQPGAIAALHAMGLRGQRRVLCTLRQDPLATAGQLEDLGIRPFLDAVFVVEPGGGGAAKASAVAEEVGRASRALWIGDTEVDAEAARRLGCDLWLVETGIRDRPALERLAPDRIVRGMLDLA